jgi:glycosyltransferase domain-containing protein
MNLDAITLIVPTYNRPTHLTRLLNYYARKNVNLHFLILDSSQMEFRSSNKTTVSRLGAQARYMDFPSSISVAMKLYEGLKLVDTPYCAFCADDDLVFIEGLSQAASHLQNNPDYVSVDGIYLNFTQQQQIFDIHVEYAAKGISAQDPGARILKGYQKYESLFYGVFRTSQAVNIFSGVSQVPTLHYQELFQTTSALLLGKTMRLPIFYAARQSCHPADPARDKWQTYYWFAENPQDFLQHYLEYREILWTFYQNHVTEQNYAKDEFMKMLDMTHAVYFSIGCPPAYFHSVFQTKWANDTYKKTHVYFDNVTNQLKGTLQKKAETNFFAFARFIQKNISCLFSPFALVKLNARNKMKCRLNRELRWLAGVDIFRDAYRELCEYAE